jgi:hypothetical protein
MPQTVVTQKPEKMIAGMLLDGSPNTMESRASAEASLEINPGAAVKMSGTSGALGCRADSDVIHGMCIWSAGHETREFSTAGGYKPTVQFDILRKGRTVVELDTGISAVYGERLYFNTSTQKWRKAAVMATTIDATKQVQCIGSSTAAGGLVAVEVDFLNAP